MSTGTVCLKCRRYIEADETWRCRCPVPLRSEDAKTPYGKPCTCDNSLGSSCACRAESGARLGDLWFCDKAWQEVKRRARLHPMNDGELWSFFRKLISQGTDIEMDRAAGRYNRYEEFSARLDAAARERVAQFKELSLGKPGDSK